MSSPKGILHIVNNYSGDRMAFEMATEMLEAEGITVKTLFVDDDVAVQDSTYTVGRRGVAGNFFVIKALGAASEDGASLDELVELGQQVNSVTRSMGMALTGCTPPAKGAPIFTLADDEIEMGVGIHGEPGRSRKKLARADDMVDEMLEAVLSDRKQTAATVEPNPSSHRATKWLLMVNGLGGTPISELYLVYGRVHTQLEQKGHQGLAQLRWRVLHVAGNGRPVDHALQSG